MTSRITIFFISLYQKTAPARKVFFEAVGIRYSYVCSFYPSCPEYCKETIRRYGLVKGVLLGVKRVSRCHPWQKNHVDLP